MKWLRNLTAKLLAPWKQRHEQEQLIAGLLLEQAQNGIVLKRLEEELAKMLLQIIDLGLNEEETKEMIAFMLIEIAKGEKE